MMLLTLLFSLLDDVLNFIKCIHTLGTIHNQIISCLVVEYA